MTEVLVTERLVLRLPRLEDAAAAAELLGNPEVMRFLGGQTVPAEDAPGVVAKWIARWEQNGIGPFVIERREDGRFLGRSGLLVWDTRASEHASLAEAGEYAQPEVDWAMARACWGHGYATEAAGAVRDWARGERGSEQLISLISPQNVRSQQVAQRLGALPGRRVRLFDSGDAVVWVHP